LAPVVQVPDNHCDAKTLYHILVKNGIIEADLFAGDKGGKQGGKVIGCHKKEGVQISMREDR